jgi:VWFA-related protein
MIRKTCVAAAAFLAVVGAAAFGARVIAQTFKAQSDLVVLQVAVHDRHSAAVPSLPREAFLVYEDAAPQDIRFFLNEDRSVAVGLVVDNSISMSPKRREVIAAAEAFARSSNPDDKLFTVNFNERVWFGLPEGVPFTSDLSVLHDALQRISARGRTAMYDGLAAALDHVNTSELDQKVLIVVSDGGDNESRLDFNGLFTARAALECGDLHRRHLRRGDQRRRSEGSAAARGRHGRRRILPLTAAGDRRGARSDRA